MMHLVEPAAKSNLSALCPQWVFLFHFVDWLLAWFDWMRPHSGAHTTLKLVFLCSPPLHQFWGYRCEPHAWLLTGFKCPSCSAAQ